MLGGNVRRLVMAIGGLVVTVGTIAYSVSNHDAHADEVCTRYVCVPAGSTAVPPTADGTRPPDVTPTAVSTVTVTREPQPTAPAGTGIVKTRDGRCYPVGGASEVPCP